VLEKQTNREPFFAFFYFILFVAFGTLKTVIITLDQILVFFVCAQVPSFFHDEN
jgi:hypothetical protein